MKSIKFTIKGTAPLLQNCDRLCNPLDELTKELKKLTSKRSKTDEDHQEINRISWFGSLYYDEDIGPYVPSRCIEAMIWEAAKLQKKGKDVKRAILCLEDKVPLEYTGPRNAEKLWKDGKGEFVDIRSVVVQRARTMKARPIFPNWAITFTINYNEDILDQAELLHFMEQAGCLIGLLDYRPKFGRFEILEAA